MITIFHVGRVRDREIAALIAEYAKRIEKYTRLAFCEVKEEKIKKSSAKEKEGERILALKRKGCLACLDPGGKMLTSEGFADFLKGRDVCFAIGGPDGLSDNVKKGADAVISLSSMTFTHEMAQLILVEQIYRAHTILNNESYHR